MTNELVARILAKYGVPFQRVLPPQKGYRNQSFPVVLAAGQTINLILYKSEPGILDKITDANRVANFLANQHFPARQTYNNKIITLTDGKRSKYGALYTYLPGKTIPWEAYTRRHIKLLGQTMSDMHAALEAQQLSTTNAIDEYEAIVKRMQRYFATPSVQKALAQKLQLQLDSIVLAQALRILQLSRKLPQQTLHMDFVRGNILFEGEGELLHISGILDFEKTSIGPKYFDIARTLAFLLVDCKYIETPKIRKYFLQSGYEKMGQGSLDWRPAISRLLSELIDLFLLYDFYKFLHHNPYEYLEQNEHFIRTRDLLQKRQRLSVSKA